MENNNPKSNQKREYCQKISLNLNDGKVSKIESDDTTSVGNNDLGSENLKETNYLFDLSKDPWELNNLLSNDNDETRHNKEIETIVNICENILRKQKTLN